MTLGFCFDCEYSGGYKFGDKIVMCSHPYSKQGGKAPPPKGCRLWKKKQVQKFDDINISQSTLF